MTNSTRLKNKQDKKLGKFLCGRCGRPINLGRIIKGYVYCSKCAQIIKGEGG
jgi:ribosomal protein L37AE/L43A